MATLSFSASGAPDGVFYWIFEATSGNSWGGWIVMDGGLAAPGDTLATAFGRYVIQSETEYATDLSGFGVDDQQVFVDWYRVGATGTFLPTLAGSSVASGQAGLGSELDRAWTGSGWGEFGLGGRLQVFATSAPAPLQPP
jgi:hypothetical protein